MAVQVHNLALYPERHSWCQATPIRQEIAASDPECAPTTIDNVVCLGACFSYAVPRAQDDVLIEPYCDACRPTVAAWTVVSLNCTRALTGERYLAPKNVELIANCSCVDCHSGARAAHAADDDHSAADSAVRKQYHTPTFTFGFALWHLSLRRRRTIRWRTG